MKMGTVLPSHKKYVIIGNHNDHCFSVGETVEICGIFRTPEEYKKQSEVFRRRNGFFSGFCYVCKGLPARVSNVRDIDLEYDDVVGPDE